MNREQQSRVPIYVSRPDLPPLEELLPDLQAIWDNHILTNAGPYHQRFEKALQEFLGCEHVALTSNGTLALVIALQSLRIAGEVITTPYSFVATSHALLWNGITPVFVDVDPETCNLDANRIEAAITPRTTAILAVHCYGQPCDVEAIQQIADLYNLRVIYDGAHAFGVEDGGGSLLRHGDLTITSFHATKVFTTFEGGAIVCPDAKHKQRIDYLKNFGFANEVTVVAPGINAKMNEFSAALGLLQLKYFRQHVAHRRRIDGILRQTLDGTPGVRCLSFERAAHHNHAYFPILVGPDYPLPRDELYERLKAHGYHCRRYFYPLITDFPPYRNLPSAQPGRLRNAQRLSQQVLCLPVHGGMSENLAYELGTLIREVPR